MVGWVRRLVKHLKLNPEVTVGDILTVLSVMVSVAALSYSWSQDRALERQRQANEVREAAANTMAKLERWKSVALSLFDLVQPHLVKTSELLARDLTREGVVTTRDTLYQWTLDSRLTTLALLRAEDIETAYVYLYGYDPRLQQELRGVLALLRHREAVVFECLQRVMQDEVFVYMPEAARGEYTTAQLGNALRNAVGQVQRMFAQDLDIALLPMERALGALVQRSDDELLDRGARDVVWGEMGPPRPIACPSIARP